MVTRELLPEGALVQVIGLGDWRVVRDASDRQIMVRGVPWGLEIRASSPRLEDSEPTYLTLEPREWEALVRVVESARGGVSGSPDSVNP